MAENNVKITVETTINDGGEDNRYELTVFGSLAKRNGSTFVRYTEITEQGELKVLVKCDGEKVEATRKGYMHIKQVFEPEKTTFAIMKTPLGDLDVLTSTENIQFSEDEENGMVQLSFNYELFVNDNLVGNYSLKICTEEISGN